MNVTLSENDWAIRRATKGCIFNIQRFSIHDGPGIRTTVFLKGCPLRCRWCHNPEGMIAQPVLLFDPAWCVACGRCVEACTVGACRLDDGQTAMALTRENCTHCGHCASVCVSRALEVAGEERTAADVLDLVLRDQAFYAQSGGGMTLSGGEPLLQTDFAEALLVLAKAQGLHTTVETCACLPWEAMERAIPWVDLWLCDLKHVDNAKHQDFTDMGNEQILANLRRLAATTRPLVVRVPAVPGFNDTQAQRQAIEGFVRTLNPVPTTEWLEYHALGDSKYRRLGLNVPGWNGKTK